MGTAPSSATEGDGKLCCSHAQRRNEATKRSGGAPEQKSAPCGADEGSGPAALDSQQPRPPPRLLLLHHRQVQPDRALGGRRRLLLPRPVLGPQGIGQGATSCEPRRGIGAGGDDEGQPHRTRPHLLAPDASAVHQAPSNGGPAVTKSPGPAAAARGPGLRHERPRRHGAVPCERTLPRAARQLDRRWPAQYQHQWLPARGGRWQRSPPPVAREAEQRLRAVGGSRAAAARRQRPAAPVRDAFAGHSGRSQRRRVRPRVCDVRLLHDRAGRHVEHGEAVQGAVLRLHPRRLRLLSAAAALLPFRRLAPLQRHRVQGRDPLAGAFRRALRADGAAHLRVYRATAAVQAKRGRRARLLRLHELRLAESVPPDAARGGHGLTRGGRSRAYPSAGPIDWPPLHLRAPPPLASPPQVHRRLTVRHVVARAAPAAARASAVASESAPHEPSAASSDAEAAERSCSVSRRASRNDRIGSSAAAPRAAGSAARRPVDQRNCGGGLSGDFIPLGGSSLKPSSSNSSSKPGQPNLMDIERQKKLEKRQKSLGL